MSQKPRTENAPPPVPLSRTELEALRADIDRAKHEPSVYLGSFAEFAADDAAQPRRRNDV